MDARAIGAMALGVGSLAVAAGLISRHAAEATAQDLPRRTTDVADRTADVASAEGTLQATMPHDAAHMTDDQALATARERFGAATFGVARTADGDSVPVHATTFSDRAESTSAAALADALAIANGNASAAVQVGDRFVGVVLDSDLAARSHRRDVAYTDTEYTYHYGLNSSTSAYEYHYGPETVMKTRSEDYSSPFDQLDPARIGVAAAADGTGRPMRDNGTGEQQALGRAHDRLTQAKSALEVSTHARTASASAGLPMLIGGGSVASVGAIALLVGLRRG